MFYLNFLRDKYKVSYICDTPKDENHYRIRGGTSNYLPKAKARGPNSNRPKTKQQKRKKKSNQGRRKRKSDGVMVMNAWYQRERE